MPHITFIHGIANKPPADQLLNLWLEALAADGGPQLSAMGVTTTMVYWADVLYPAPLPEPEVLETVGGTGPGVSSGGLEAAGEKGADMPAVAAAPPPETGSVKEAALVVGLAAKFGAVDAMAAVEATATAPADELERIPLPGFVTRRVMESYLRDVHHYLFNARFSPRDGESYAVRDEIRGRAIKLLQAGAQMPGPHVVVGHSLGSVIAYDCLKLVPGCPRVDGLLTLGSPLGLDEVQDQLPGWTRADGFPTDTLLGRWVNVFDRLDPVAGFDPLLANDFRKSGNEVVVDINEQNFGRWRHDSSKYFRGARLRTELLRLLGLPPG